MTRAKKVVSKKTGQEYTVKPVVPFKPKKRGNKYA